MKMPFVFGPGVVEPLPPESAPEYKFRADLENCRVPTVGVWGMGRDLNFESFCSEPVSGVGSASVAPRVKW